MNVICINPESLDEAVGQIIEVLDTESCLTVRTLAAAQGRLEGQSFDLMLLHFSVVSALEIQRFVERNAGTLPIVVLCEANSCVSVEALINAGAEDVFIPAGGPLGHIRQAVVKAICRHQRGRHVHCALQQSQKMEAVGRMAGGIAHDYNNLLTIILNDAVLIRDALPPDIEVQEDISEQISVIKQAAGLTRRLLVMARGRPLVPAVCDLNRQIGGMENILRHVSGDRIALSLQLHPDPLFVSIDAGQIEQALLNLMINACDSIWYQGGVTVTTGLTTLEQEPSEFCLTPDSRPGVPYAFVAVRDTGAGIQPGDSTRIFEPFFTTKESQRGSGLGLYQVYRSVSQHNGAITLESEPGKGTTIKLLFALSEYTADAADATGTMTAAREGAPKGITVLLVEDDNQVRRTTRRLLERSGYSVMDADGRDSVMKLGGRLREVQVLIADVMMPGINGLQLADELRREFPAIRVLLSSGYPEGRLRQLDLLRDEYRFIAKPFFQDKLARLLEEILLD
jgi:signal transduction histidine kinase/CheY-like chemotaxis protein